ncbi:MAG: glucose-phosphate cytidylyltransferase [Solirubrobacteraceae bacterium]|nr:glucose-phosphate cytidylyltransferase [Solirubrobacteraceae bacterium]
MKAVILAGGLGSRLSEETTVKPKPMVEIGGKPILWHIMKIYAAHGVEDFVVCLGYKGYVVKEWFANYALHTSDVTFDLRDSTMEVHRSSTEPWRVTLVDTGASTMTGGRLRRALPFLDGETFCLTYGDGVSDVDVGALIARHGEIGALVTVTAVQAPGRFGALEVADRAQRARGFREKPPGDGPWINGGFFVCEPAAVTTITGDEVRWEGEPLAELAARGELGVHYHDGFWHAMDTLSDRMELDELWNTGRAPWRIWS